MKSVMVNIPEKRKFQMKQREHVCASVCACYCVTRGEHIHSQSYPQSFASCSPIVEQLSRHSPQVQRKLFSPDQHRHKGF